MVEKIALFPLNVVLFPFMPLSLQLFEPRYLEMLEDLQRDDSVFGVNLIESGQEVGGDAMPNKVGCTARIVRTHPQADGRVFLLARGEQRYRIEALDRTKPYLQATVRYFKDHVTDERALLPLARTVLERFRSLLEEAGMKIEIDDRLLEDASRISYVVAAHIGGENEDRLHLLELDSVGTRLELLDQMTREKLDEVRTKKKVEKVVGRNGRLRREP